MSYSNQLVGIAREVLAIEADLPYRLDYSEERPTIDDFELFTFKQMWGSTALGFGGIGGQAMTEARTYVFVPVTCNQKCFIYFKLFACLRLRSFLGNLGIFLLRAHCKRH